MGDDAGSQGADARGIPLTDAAGADDPDCQRADLAAALCGPRPGSPGPVARDDAAQGGEGECEGMLGHGPRVRTGRVRHDHSGCCGGYEIHRVGPDAIPGQDPQPRRGTEMVDGDRSNACNPALCIGKGVSNRVQVMVVGDPHDPATGFGEPADEVDVSGAEGSGGDDERSRDHHSAPAGKLDSRAR